MTTGDSARRNVPEMTDGSDFLTAVAALVKVSRLSFIQRDGGGRKYRLNAAGEVCGYDGGPVTIPARDLLAKDWMIFVPRG